MADHNHDILFSFFMFTADLQPSNPDYAKQIVGHMKKLLAMGYKGFDLPIAPTATFDHAPEVAAYEGLRKALDDARLYDMHLTTNVGATRTFDPSSPYKEQRDIALSYLKSRVDITKALRGDVMAGPIVLPYGVFPVTDGGAPIWSDALQDWVKSRYDNAKPVIKALGEHAAKQGVKIAIEPVDHWETAPPNLVGEVVNFLDGIPNRSVGICIDSAHVVLGSDGPARFTEQAGIAMAAKRVHYVHISAPDRGAVHDSWIPWQTFLKPFKEFQGPYLIEVFNAIPVFLNSLRLARRKFRIPEDGDPCSPAPDAYTVASEGLTTLRNELGKGYL